MEKNINEKNVKLYYIIIGHDYVILKTFQVSSKLNLKKKHIQCFKSEFDYYEFI